MILLNCCFIDKRNLATCLRPRCAVALEKMVDTVAVYIIAVGRYKEYARRLNGVSVPTVAQNDVSLWYRA